jgi:hypothetical protein
LSSLCPVEYNAGHWDRLDRKTLLHPKKNKHPLKNVQLETKHSRRVAKVTEVTFAPYLSGEKHALLCSAPPNCKNSKKLRSRLEWNLDFFPLVDTEAAELAFACRPEVTQTNGASCATEKIFDLFLGDFIRIDFDRHRK